MGQPARRWPDGLCEQSAHTPPDRECVHPGGADREHGIARRQVSAEQRELQAISPGQVAAYLSAAGWRATARTPTTVKWRLDLKDRDRSLILVTDREDPDYEDYLMVLVARLRDVEQRDGQSIYRDMLDAGRDTLVIRVSAPNITEGEVPVSYGTELYGGVRDLIAAGGRSVRTTRASFAGPTPPEVMDVLDRLTF